MVDQILGKKTHLDYNIIPSVVFTHPEGINKYIKKIELFFCKKILFKLKVASIGRSEEEL